jgi:hypothetical protein
MRLLCRVYLKVSNIIKLIVGLKLLLMRFSCAALKGDSFSEDAPGLELQKTMEVR